MRNLRTPLQTQILGGILVFAALCIIGCSKPAGVVASTRSGISPRMESTGILFIELWGTPFENRSMLVCITIEGRTSILAVNDGVQTEKLVSTSIIPQDKLEAIWLAADDLVRSSPDLRNTPAQSKSRVGNALCICVEGRHPSGEYMLYWPPGPEPSDPKVCRLLGLLEDVVKAARRLERGPSASAAQDAGAAPASQRRLVVPTAYSL